jgi:dephospho-CoA kinase
LIIGLTGGIASGKSTAAQLLGAWGAYVIDADKLGHSAYEKGSTAFDHVVTQFGPETVGDDGEIDRKILGGKVFGDPEALRALTDIVWPAIRAKAHAEITSALAQSPTRPVVLEAAVLIEAQWQDLADEIWVTVVDREVAIERASTRDGSDRTQVEARIDSQISNEERCAEANEVIDNSGSATDLEARLKQLWALVDTSTRGQTA